jgi:hypothetical protein
LVALLANLSILACQPSTEDASSGNAAMNAVELLTAISGKTAIEYEPFFRFSAESGIVDVAIHGVGTESTTARYSGV